MAHFTQSAVLKREIEAKLASRIPFAESLDAVSKTNWEGTGVIPDVTAVSGTDALTIAEKLAINRMQI